MSLASKIISFVAAGFVVLALLLYMALRDRPFYSTDGIALPEDKLSYAGAWNGDHRYLLIEPSGKVFYKRMGATNVSLDNLPIQKFEGDDFVVGVFFWGTTFKVSAVPHMVDGAWHMTVDGVDLKRNAQ